MIFKKYKTSYTASLGAWTRGDGWVGKVGLDWDGRMIVVRQSLRRCLKKYHLNQVI